MGVRGYDDCSTVATWEINHEQVQTVNVVYISGRAEKKSARNKCCGGAASNFTFTYLRRCDCGVIYSRTVNFYEVSGSDVLDEAARLRRFLPTDPHKAEFRV